MCDCMCRIHVCSSMILAPLHSKILSQFSRNWLNKFNVGEISVFQMIVKGPRNVRVCVCLMITKHGFMTRGTFWRAKFQEASLMLSVLLVDIKKTCTFNQENHHSWRNFRQLAFFIHTCWQTFQQILVLFICCSWGGTTGGANVFLPMQSSIKTMHWLGLSESRAPSHEKFLEIVYWGYWSLPNIHIQSFPCYSWQSIIATRIHCSVTLCVCICVCVYTSCTYLYVCM